MKNFNNLFLTMLAVALALVSLGFAGCATHSTGFDNTNPWEYKTVTVNAFSEGGMRFEVQQYVNQGWSIVSSSTASAPASSTPNSRFFVLVMKRPRPVFTKIVIPPPPAANK